MTPAIDRGLWILYNQTLLIGADRCCLVEAWGVTASPATRGAAAGRKQSALHGTPLHYCRWPCSPRARAHVRGARSPPLHAAMCKTALPRVPRCTYSGAIVWYAGRRRCDGTFGGAQVARQAKRVDAIVSIEPAGLPSELASGHGPTVGRATAHARPPRAARGSAEPALPTRCRYVCTLQAACTACVDTAVQVSRRAAGRRGRLHLHSTAMPPFLVCGA
ncbi:hypothetical protein T440DRAFT_61166 [Plenodomus tracheiphilus IPT5]|uniref:Uncharacterized protein n=1 Tax=Plenodomus tracheiphilus IPT5 TaxID=1408161 RepID=A0A6A7BAG0_9PLEO|nr:hypothetical protein T440DRAFT_61166 [Plenodomus tracheiphilus IPT5]